MLYFSETDEIKEVQDQGKAIWVAELTDGSLVYQDEEKESPAWLRLGQYLNTCPVWVKTIHLKFRTNWVRNIVPEDQSTLFFTQKSAGFLGGQTDNFYLFGWAKESRSKAHHLHIAEFSVPSLIRSVDYQREAPFSDHRLILRSGYLENYRGKKQNR